MLVVCVYGCVFVLIITGKQKHIYQMFKSAAVPLLRQAERISIYLARIPLIYHSFFRVVAVLLAEPSDLYTGSVWISVVSVKRFPGSLPKWRDSTEWALGLPVLAVPAVPGAWHEVPLSGGWSLAKPALWLCLGVALLVTVEASPLLWEEEFSLNLGFGFLLILWG